MSKTYDLDWHGEEVVKIAEGNLEKILAEFTLTAEGEAKKELVKGHGVETGTLRRSIHAADADYDFSGDDVEPSASSPERGGKEIKPTKSEHRFLTALGSGLVYAMRIHQGWGVFTGYHYLTIGVEKAKGRLDTIIGRYQVKE